MAKAKKEEVKAPAKGKVKKAAEVVPVEEAKPAKGKKAAAPVIKEVKGRGRKPGIRNEITEKNAKALKNQFEAMESQFNTLAENVGALIEKSNKSAAKDARTCCQNLVKMLKPFRQSLQQAKTEMKQVSV